MEVENHRAKADLLDQQLRKIDEQVKQNDGLLRRTLAEQKKANVTLFTSSFITFSFFLGRHGVEADM